MNRMTLVLALLTLADPADACHKFSIWRYPYPQRCPPHVARIAQHELQPPPSPHFKVVDETPFEIVPVPSLEGMDFCCDQGGNPAWERLKAIGMMRQLRGTN